MSVYYPLFSVIVWPLGVLIAGAALAWAGRRGRRVDDHPACRRCGFDLVGRPQGSQLCPECGADLERRRAIVTGTRAPRPALLVAGVVLLAAGGLRLLNDVRREVAPDPTAYKPTWWLLRETGAADPARRNASLLELGRRLEHDQLSQSTIDLLTDRALAAQADVGVPWAGQWGDWVEAVDEVGKLSDSRRERYLRQAVVPWFARLSVRPRVRRGDPFPLLIQGERTPRLASWTTGWDEQIEFLFDDRPRLPAEDRHRDIWLAMPGIGGVVPSDQVPYDELRDGRHTFVLRGSFPLFFGRHATRPAGRLPFRLEATWELVPENAPVAEVVDDPSLRETIAPLLAAGVEFWGHDTKVHVSFNRLPIGVAYDVVLRSGAKEWVAGSLCVPPGVYVHRELHAAIPGWNGGPIDILLRPNPAAAKESPDVLRVWNQPIELKNVVANWREPPRWRRQ